MNSLRPIGRVVARHAPAKSALSMRALNTMIPPKIAVPEGLDVAKGLARVNHLKDFYSKLPKGSAPEMKVTGPITWYANKYFGKNQSPAPIWHFIFFMIVLGYSQEYYFHLRHHKNHAH